MRSKLVYFASAAFLSLFLLAIPTTSNAQSIFDVELVFFKRVDKQDNEAQVANDNLNIEDSGYSLTSSNLPENYRLLERSEQKLEGVYNRLRSSASMRPLLHIGWRQELNDKDLTPWLSFTVSDEATQKGLINFNGAIRFSRNQGLLIENKIVGFREASLNTGNGVEENTPEDQIPDELSGYFLLNESRKIKLGDLNYFDHPNMGILIKVSPYQVSLEEQEQLQNSQ
ncbi:MAG: hypothetical protein HWD86_05630 [Kangiellaceae bacterium]|nr:hypothetical protein [Kangiellaceae bacterium]